MLLPVAVAVVAVAVRHRSLRGLLRVRLRAVWLIWVAAGVQFLRVTEPAALQGLLHYRQGLVPVLATWAFGTGFVLANVRGRPVAARVGLAVLAVGFTLNTLVVTVNGHMPFSASAARTAGFTAQAATETSTRYAPVSGRTALAAFGDLIPVPPLQSVVSVGDLLMFAGIAAVPWPWSASPPPERR
jgi:hypothetical protein